MEWLQIKSGQGDYNVDSFGELKALVQSIQRIQKSVLLIDRNIANLYMDDMAPLINGLPTLLIDAIEDEKTITGISRVLNFFQENGCMKQTVVVAIGGGIIQDIATFTAHAYYRGIKWVYIPTTLLSMSDSCIGAKCGINLNAFKNQLGVFHSPARVLICVKFLDTLSDTDIRSGYGEILKLMLTQSAELYDGLRTHIDQFGFRNSELATFIYQSLNVKKSIIEVDEYEIDLRRILNYGHTFGHSLEAVTQHEVPHGLGVAWGIDVANFISLRRGMLSEADFSSIHDFIVRHFNYRISCKVSAAELIQGAWRDKKVSDGKLNMVLLEKPGSLKIVPIAFDGSLESIITEYLSNSHVVYWD